MFIFIPVLVVAIVGGAVAAIKFGVISNPLTNKSTPSPVVNPSPQEEAASQSPLEGTTPTVEQSSATTPDEQRAADIEFIANTLDNYYIQNVAYPKSSSSGFLVHINNQMSPCKELILNSFLVTCPQDPAGEPAFYSYRSNGNYYELTAKLDDPSCRYANATFDGKTCIYSKSSLLTPAERNKERVSDLYSVFRAVEAYAMAEGNIYGSYPPASSYDDLTNYLIGETRFINKLPKDPLGGVYNYIVVTGTGGQSSSICTSANCTTYVLSAFFEDSIDNSQYLGTDFDGNFFGVSCDDPTYCIAQGPAI